YFATRIAGAPPLNRAGAANIVPLTTEQMANLQRALIRQGYEGVGEADGKFGAGTRAATKKAQMKLGLPADSYPTVELLERLGGARTVATP
ncbi:MAG TPA: peptidoglycan-binding domain-containing protein, partial [Pseudolabrys sp.]|nr:peptidoglycan-binding domain-containing protein [Pseudolabrys sp.]